MLADLQTAQKLASKYREPVSLVGSAPTRVEDPVAQNAAASLSNVAGSLEAILAMPVPGPLRGSQRSATRIARRGSRSSVDTRRALRRRRTQSIEAEGPEPGVEHATTEKPRPVRRAGLLPSQYSTAATSLPPTVNEEGQDKTVADVTAELSPSAEANWEITVLLGDGPQGDT